MTAVLFSFRVFFESTKTGGPLPASLRLMNNLAMTMDFVDDAPMDEDMLHRYTHDESAMEPTPLSEAIHKKHLLHQQHQQIGLIPTEQQQSRSRKTQNRCLQSMDRPLRQKRRGKVGFASHVLLHFSPYDLDEIVGSWYMKEDFVQFRTDRKATVKALHNANCNLALLDPEKYNSRGLEAYFSARIYKTTQWKRAEVVTRVLAAQENLRKGLIDTESIRNISCEGSEWARRRGLQLGRDDADTVVREMSSQQGFGCFPLQQNTLHSRLACPQNYRSTK